MLPLGRPIPRFELMEPLTGATIGSPAPGQPALVMFLCNHCPYVVHIRAQLLVVAHRAVDAGIAVVAINSNSIVTHPEDGPVAMAALAGREGWRFPFLFDETQEVAKAFGAACTPDLFLFGPAGLYYRGQIDDARPGSPLAVTGADLAGAIDRLVAGEAAPADQWPSLGCNIKWHPGC
jgi:thiol-disulfide isomerase/thioredoxin